MDIFIIIMLGACGLVIWLLHVIRNKLSKTPDFLRVEEDEVENYRNNKYYQPSYAEQDEQIEDLLNIVENHIDNGDRASADANLEAFEEIIRKYPNRSYAYTQYARALDLQTDDEFENNVINPNRDKILELIHKAVDIDPNKSDVYETWSHILFNMALSQDIENERKELLHDAINKCEKAIELEPDNYALYSNYADILEGLYDITEEENLITRCNDLHEKSTRIKSSSYNYKYWAMSTKRFADSTADPQLYQKAISLFDTALERNQQEFTESSSALSEISESRDKSKLSLGLKEMHETMCKLKLYEKENILRDKAQALFRHGIITDNIQDLEKALNTYNVLSDLALEIDPNRDPIIYLPNIIFSEMTIAEIKGCIKSEAPNLEAKLMRISNITGESNISYAMMMLKSLTGEIKESFDWFIKYVEKEEDLDWEYLEENEKLANLIQSEEYKKYKALHYKEEKKEETISVNIDNSEDNQAIGIKAEYTENESLPNELKEKADTLSVQALENQDVTLFEQAIQKYEQCRQEAENVGDKQLISICDLQIVQNIFQLSKLKNDLPSATLDIESRIVNLFDSHYQEVCILAIKLKALVGDTNSAIEWLDRFRKSSVTDKLDWTYFEQDDDFKDLVQSYEYNQYKELFK